MSGVLPARVIRTPDQRIRVFVSSTLRELEPERQAARAAIELLHLAPVMFELGARPHPPRALYRAYLAQSDIFVGVYWEQYGWVAPGEEVSGLEDEYRLADSDMPKLIYVKEPAERDERLAVLMARIRDDDTASYKSFADADELARLLETDLATLLAERFDAGRPTMAAAVAEPVTGRMPTPSTAILGRSAEVSTLLVWLGDTRADERRRLITLVGPGGIGKSRLAIEVARLATERFDRVTFVPLEHIRDPDDMLPAIARELGVRAGEDLPLIERLARARAGRRDLLVLDNFEQIIEAAPDVAMLLARLADATVVVTSRARLRIHGEQVFDLDPLDLPHDAENDPLAEIGHCAAVRLFTDRARAADSRFQLTESNGGDVARLCRALDGVPLAIELAAAGIRALSPAAMLKRLDSVLARLPAGDRDAPERQRTIQTTIEWSLDLLDADAQALFTRLGVFAGDFSLDAAEAVTADDPSTAGLLETLLELVDASLLRAHDVDGVPIFSMLAPVREIAAAQFDGCTDAAVVRLAHGEYYVRLAAEVEPLLRGSTQSAAVQRLDAERDNLRVGFRHLITAGHVDAVADAVWRLLLYWWIEELLLEAKAWMRDVLQAGVPRTDRARAVARLVPEWVSEWQPGAMVDVEAIEYAVALLHEAKDAFSEGCALTILAIAFNASTPPRLDRAEEALRRALELVPVDVDPSFNAVFRSVMGTTELLRGRPAEALTFFEAALADAVRAGDRFVEGITLTNVGWSRLALGEAHPEFFTRHLEITLSFGGEDGIGYAFEGLTACEIVLGDIERAGTFLGAAETIRRRTGIFDRRSYVTYGPFVERVLASAQADRFQAARDRGHRLSRADAVQLALETAAS
ncbi:ATP-binding protein [Microbacterium sp. B2969]|uniref:ATP-binding protein n=1 Tax=Microbacterium alkaliflavum TaxID=3248839 RepID=A0ABW7Q390_9MICO